MLKEKAGDSLWQSPGWYRATTLAERATLLHAEGQLSSQKSTCDEEQREKALLRLQRWKEQAPFDHREIFTERLALDGLNEQELLVLLAEPVEAVQARLPEPPSWFIWLKQAFSQFEAARVHSLPLPSIEIPSVSMNILYALEPLLQHGLRQLASELQSRVKRYSCQPFEPETIPSMFVVDLAEQLVPRLKRTLMLECKVAHLRGYLTGETEEEHFESYLQWLRQPERLLTLLEEYSVLARQLVLVVQRWIAFTLEFLEHLCADWQRICTVFFCADDPGLLVNVTLGAGGIYQPRGAVVQLRFASGCQLVYKSRSLSVDVHFQELLTWLNTRGQQPLLRTLALIDCGTHGWCEFIAASPSQSEQEERRFYERLGAYLALLYILCAKNVREEHIVAVGEHPVLTDLAMLFQSGIAGSAFSRHPAHKAFSQSVVSTGLLSRDLSPDYHHALSAGFAHTCSLLERHRDEFLASILPRFAHDEICFRVRPTEIYTHLLSETFSPNLLRDALQKNRSLDRLWQAVKEQPYLLRTIAAEQADLLEGNIPLFMTYPDQRDLYTSCGKRIPAFFVETALEAASQRLLQLNAESIVCQLRMMRGVFAGIAMTANPSMASRLTLQPTSILATRERLIQAACTIGDHLCDHAYYDNDAAGWSGMTVTKRGKKFKWALQPLDEVLYAGTPGIALFLAYLGHITNQVRYTHLAGAALKTVRIEIEQRKKSHRASEIGAFNGWGGFVYLFTHLGVLWNNTTLFEEAQEIVMLSAQLIERDEKLDILSGSAGCVLSLLNLYAVTRSASILAVAVQCGEHLLARAQSLKEGIGWHTFAGSPPLTGFSHGAAGIAYSLLALAEVSGQERFRAAALAALAYERSLFSPEEQNWPDLRAERNAGEDYQAGHALQYACMWCHGAPGIGLARLASLPYLNDMQIHEEIAAALKTTLARGFGHNHSLCHGDLGNLETLLVATQVPGNQWCHQQYEQITAMVLESIEAGSWITGVPLGAETPGLMNGLAGVGYELLRLAETEHVPSVLLLAPPHGSRFT